MKIHFLVWIILLPFQLHAHPGKLANDGCHYCRSNCQKYGLTAGKRHSHDENIQCDPQKGPQDLLSAKVSKSILNPSKNDHFKYNRNNWPHWIDEDNDCQNTRQEILILRSKTIPVLDKKGCTVISGHWDDFYFNETINQARDIDIDYIVPLKEVANTGLKKNENSLQMIMII